MDNTQTKLPVRMNLYQAEAWVRYRLTEAVEKIADWESLAGNKIWRYYPTIPGTAGALHTALKSGAIIAQGLERSGAFKPIPSIEWERMRPASDARLHSPYVRILLERDHVCRLWPLDKRQRQFDWDKIQSWYPEFMAARPGIGKRGIASNQPSNHVTDLLNLHIGHEAPRTTELQSWTRKVSSLRPRHRS